MSLINELIKGLLPEQENKKVVAVYGGGFKPPTKGHFAVIKQALKENPEIDEFIVFIGGKERNGISPDESILIWDIYKQYLPFKVEIKYTSTPPIKSVYNYAKDHPDEEVLFIIGAREGNEDDFKDIASRTTTLDKYPNLNLRTIVTQGGVSGTAARNASKISLDKFKPFVPTELSDEEVEQVYNIVADKITEGRKKKKDPKKGTGKKPEGSKRRLYTDEDPKDTIGIKFSTRQDIVNTLNKTSFKAKSHARQSQIINLIHQRVRAAYGRAKDPKVKKRLKAGLDYITKRKEASKKKTQRLKKLKEEYTIENYTNGKVKDQLQKYIDDYTEIDLNLLKKLLKDKKKYPQELDPRTGGNKFGYRGMTFKKEFIDKLKPVRTSNGVTEYEIPSNLKVTSRSDKGYLSFTTEEEVAKGFGHYSGYVDYKKSPDRVGGYVRVSLDNPNFILHPDFTGELSKDLEYSKESEKETLLIGSSFTPDKIYVVDEKLKEGDTIEKYSAKGKATGKLKQGTVRKRLNIPKGKKIPISLINKEISRLKKMDKDPDKKGAQLGDKNQKYYKALQLSKTLKTTTNVNENASYTNNIDILKHIDDLTRYMIYNGMNIQPLPTLELIDGDTENAKDFFGKTAYYDPNEQHIVLYTEGRHPKDIVRSYAHEMIHHIQYLEDRLGDVSTTNTMEDDHLDKIEQEANLRGTMTFRNWTDSLNEGKNKDPFGLNAYAMELGRLNEEESEYKVYLDMDGVLADFDQRFRDISGMEPREFENKYGRKAFWNLIDEENKIKFWVGIPVMDGAAALVNAVKDYDYELLTSPSAKKQSYLGKILWVKNHTGNVFPSKPRINFKRAKEKHEVKPQLSQTDILIDDREDTIGRWNAAGGTGIVYKSIGQVLSDLKKLGL